MTLQILYTVVDHFLDKAHNAQIQVHLPKNIETPYLYKYIQDLVIPSMTHLDTLVNVALIVHWPLVGKLHREHWL